MRTVVRADKKAFNDPIYQVFIGFLPLAGAGILTHLFFTIMNNLQDNRLSMYLAVQKNCQANASHWNTNTVAVQAFAEFEQCILTIQQSVRQQARPVTGVSLEKAGTREQMVDKAYVLAQALATYGKAANQLEMVDMVNHTPSTWRKFRSNMAKERVEQVIQAARPLLPQLSPYGIQSEQVTELETLLQAYVEKMSAPRGAISNRHEATRLLRACFLKSDALLEQLDSMLLQYKDKAFYSTYKHVRQVVNRRPRGGKVQVEAVEH